MKSERHGSGILSSGPGFEKAKDYWLNKLSGEIGISHFPFDFKKTKGARLPKTLARFRFPPEVSTRIINGSGASESGIYLFLTSGVIYLLHRYTGNEDIIVGTPLFKNSAALEGMNNVMVLRSQVKCDSPFKDFLSELKGTVEEAIEFQNFPFARLAALFGLKIEEDDNPFFSAFVLFENLHGQECLGNTNSDIIFRFSKFENMLKCAIEYNSRLYRKEKIEQIFKHLVNFSKIATEQPDNRLSEIEIMSREERQKLVFDFNNSAADYPKRISIHEIFEEQAKRTPDNIALVYKDRQLTYRELNERSNQLARLLRDKGVAPDTLVGIMVEHSLEMIVGIYGILKAGGGYLPISPEYPVERIRFMLDDSQATVLLTQRHLEGKARFRGEVLFLDDEKLYTGERLNLEYVGSSSNLAYVNYTSGSTGQPKGVMIEHKSVVNLLFALQEDYPLMETDSYLLTTPYTFDVSVTEIFGWFLGNGRLIIHEEEKKKDLTSIPKAVKAHNITHINFAPSVLGILFDVCSEADLRALSELKYFFVAGEAILPELVERFYHITKAVRFENLYGPTEATVYATKYPLEDLNDEKKNVPIGKPLRNNQIYILDKRNRLQPVGVPGELHIAGEGLARGYWNRPELTAEKFVPNPFCSGERMYKSGDLAMWLPDGNIEFLGRIDYQVKLRGIRIETGEIETHLLGHELIKQAVVIAREDKAGNKYLCAFFVSTGQLRSTELREYLSEHLPAYMIPSYFVQLERLPLTTSGKVDRKNLPAIDFHTRQQLMPDYVAPRTEMEKRLAAVWSEVLKVEKVGLEDNFFELGGHSLTAIQMLARVRAQMAVELRVKDIFERPVLGELARYIEESSKAGEVKPGDDITPLPKQEEYELSNAQKRLWFLYKFEPESTFYNVPQRLLIKGELNLPAFEAALQYLIQRHDSLRTLFTEHEGIPQQVISERLEFKLEFHDLAGHPEKQEALAQMINDDQQQPFDLAVGPLLRAKLFRLEDQEHCFYLNIHHIVFDGWSHDIFFREFGEAYAAIVKARIPVLKPLPFRYVDYAAWQNRQLKEGRLAQQEEYWLQTLAKPLPVMELPLDFPRPKRQTFHGDLYAFKIDQELAEQLKRLAQERNVTVFMLLLSAYFVLLHRLTQEDDIIVGIPTSGRPLEALEALVGFFVNSVAIRIRFDRPALFKRLLEQVKQRCLEALQHQDYPFDLLVEKVNPERDMSRSPLFSTMFVMQDSPDLSEFSQLKIEALENIHTTSKFDVTMRAMVIDSEMSFAVGYNTGLFHRTTIAQMAQRYQMILNAIAAEAKN